MFEDKQTLIKSMHNPMRIASLALNEIEARMDGTRIIADPNSPFCQLLEFGSSVSSSVMHLMDEKLPTLYPKRAESMEDLYNHMSDFDYLSMYSTPAHTQLRMTFSKKWLIDNAINYNQNYKLVTLPAGTVFMLGKYPFGIHYPINIMINNYTKTFTCVYDNRVTNPLHELNTNVIEKYDASYRGLEYLVMDFPIYQFAKSTITESLVAESGFTTKVSYNNDFYAIRLFSYKNGKYIELAQSQSKIVYDNTVPTALVRVLPDEKRIKIVIPQIYFDKNLLGSKLLIEVYTTLGELDIDTSNITAANIGITYNVGEREDGAYSYIFKNLPFDSVPDLSGTMITGGSNAVSIDILRNRVVNDTLYDRVPITEGQIESYMQDNGFYVKKFKDNVTDRVYHAYRVIKDQTNSVIPSLTMQMALKESYKDGGYSPFRYQNADNSITVLPTAIYKYDQDKNSAIPLTDEELKVIATAQETNKQKLADILNNTQYLKHPFHLRVSFANQYPQVHSFDLFTNSVDRVLFDEDNYEMAEKMMAFSAQVYHDPDVIGEYAVEISVFKSDELKDLPETDIKLYVAVKTNEDNWVGCEAKWVRNDETFGRAIYRFTIPTNYHLTLNNEIGVNFPQSYTSTVTQEQLINLQHDFNVVFMVKRSALSSSTIVEPSASLVKGVPESLTSMFLGLSRQHLTITLGKNLSDVIRNDVELSTTSTKYATYETDIPRKYTEDQYKRKSDGSLYTEVDESGNLQVVIEHYAGENMKDAYGEIIYAHRKGEIKYDKDGNPIVLNDREKLYYVSMMFMDAKVFFSDRSAETTFQGNMYGILEGYFDTVRNMQDQLLERTNIFFRCVRSTGLASINRGDGISDKQNIEMSFKIVCYVPSYVKQSETIQNEITEMTCNAIEESISSKTISMLDIFATVKSKLSDYIDHFDLLGVNDDIKLQTFVITDEDAMPSVARKLELTEDNILSLNKQIEITYVALDSNKSNVVTVTE